MDRRPHEWIDTPEGVLSLAAAVRNEPIIGLDSESDSFHHYQEQVCLMQVCTPARDFLLDTVAVRDLSALTGPLGDPAREVVFNGADYDIVCLKRDFGLRFGRIFDTVVGAQLLGYQATGLAALLERHFGVQHTKRHQRDEWYRRPLSDDQLRYALNDIRYLLPLRERIRGELVAAGRLAWAEEEFEIITRREWTREPFQADHFWRIRGSRDLSRREQAILRELAVVRDARARAINRPHFKVVSDHALTDIARARPRTLADLQKIRGVSGQMARRMGEDLLDAVRRGLQVPEDRLPQAPRGERRPHDPAFTRRLHALKEWRAVKAAQLGVDPGVLAPLSILQTLARAAPPTAAEAEALPGVTRWRAREFGAEWVEALGPRPAPP